MANKRAELREAQCGPCRRPELRAGRFCQEPWSPRGPCWVFKTNLGHPFFFFPAALTLTMQPCFPLPSPPLPGGLFPGCRNSPPSHCRGPHSALPQ